MQGSSNSFDCLGQLQQQATGGAAAAAASKRRRRKRAQSVPAPSPGGNDRGDHSAAAAGVEVGDLGADSDAHSTGSGPAEYGAAQPLGDGDGSSELDLPRQASEGCLDPLPSAAAAGPSPFRSKSDLSSNLAELHSLAGGQHRASETGLDSILEASGSMQPDLGVLPSPAQPPAPRQPLSPRQQKPLRRRASMSEALFQPFSDYLSAELHPGPSYPTADVVWGQTERDRVYNAILAVPYQLERFLWFGMLVCLDSFLAVFTLLPVRFAYALYTAARDCLASRRSRQQQAQQQQQGQAQAQQQRRVSKAPSEQQEGGPQQPAQPQLPPDDGSFPGSAAAAALAAAAAAGSGGGAGEAAPPAPAARRLRGDQLYDLLGVLIFVGTVLFLWHLNAGALYFWMKDLTQEFLKLSVLFTALELGDKICCNFGVDVLEALAASCTQFMASPAWVGREAASLASDVAVASLLVVLHGAALMAQAMVFGVAMNSKKHALVALLIAANFTEIKGTVLKRFDSSKLYVLACQDVVERFHLLITLAFVLVEEMASSGHTTPNRAILVQCAQIFFSEAVIDVIKHAVLGKFNEIRPGVYREFMKDLCEKVSGAQSHNIHKVVGFEPFAPTALALRIAVTFLALAYESFSPASPWQACRAAATAAAAWVVLFAAKILLGYLLKLASASYVRHYEARRVGHGIKAGGRRVTLATFPAGSGAKKEE